MNEAAGVEQAARKRSKGSGSQPPLSARQPHFLRRTFYDKRCYSWLPTVVCTLVTVAHVGQAYAGNDVSDEGKSSGEPGCFVASSSPQLGSKKKKNVPEGRDDTVGVQYGRSCGTDAQHQGTQMEVRRDEGEWGRRGYGLGGGVGSFTEVQG